MGRSRYKIYDDVYPYFITSSIMQGYPLFSRPPVARIILNSLSFLQERRQVTLFGYVIMENHLHVVALGEVLSKKIRLFKSYTARESINWLRANGHTNILRFSRQNKQEYNTRSTYQIWQEGFHPKQIIGDDMMIQKLEYIHQNPVRRGYVDNPEDWRYSSARNYLESEALIPITCYRR
ncbi:REP-associated tyrosine transposase [Aliifodinibius sp. S!AR15-10]|uniref:REP-associated tyrosine transposase n=1 Tax=Aliifodinibius sp. S!AR15-10 TaxID=2950437 RepID=UPI002870803A|nr:transposase [Aliifodinibius sp. S!AR15-10]